MVPVPTKPLEQQTQPSTSASVTHFGAPPEQVMSRAPKLATPAPAPDFSNLKNLIKHLAVPNASPAQTTASQSTFAPGPAAAPPITASAPDLSSGLSALGQGQGQAAPQAPMPFAGAQQPAAAPAMNLGAIMAAIASAGNSGLPQLRHRQAGQPFFQPSQNNSNSNHSNQMEALPTKPDHSLSMPSIPVMDTSDSGMMVMSAMTARSTDLNTSPSSIQIFVRNLVLVLE